MPVASNHIYMCCEAHPMLYSAARQLTQGRRYMFWTYPHAKAIQNLPVYCMEVSKMRD